MYFFIDTDQKIKGFSPTFAEMDGCSTIELDFDPDIEKLSGYRYEDGEIIFEQAQLDAFFRNAAAAERIEELKAALADTDYVILKVVEGAATLADYAAVIQNRAAWRKEINEIETGGGR